MKKRNDLVNTIPSLGNRIPVMIMIGICFLIASNCSKETDPLQPSDSVYFLSGRGTEAQVWMLELDSLTASQLTDVETGINQYAVSPRDGSIAYITNGQLYLDQPGQGKPQLLANPDLTPHPPDYDFSGEVTSPSFSPDGQWLAYQLYGIRLFNLITREDELILASPGNLLGESFVFAKEYYSPGSWSPDGQKLLIEMGYFEGSTLAIWEPGAAQPFRRLWSRGAVCCQFNWSADSQTVLVSNPYYSNIPPGVWSYDTQTGQETTLVDGTLEEGPLLFAGWPAQNAAGEIIYFSTIPETSNDYILLDGKVTFVMMRLDSPASAPVQIRLEKFAIAEVLWSVDGSLAVIIQPDDSGWAIVLTDTNASPLQTLYRGELIRYLSWGP